MRAERSKFNYENVVSRPTAVFSDFNNDIPARDFRQIFIRSVDD